MLNNGHGRSHAAWDKKQPQQVRNKIGLGVVEENVKPLSSPSRFWIFACRHIKQHIPIPVHYVEDDNRDQNHEIEKIMRISWPIFILFWHSRKNHCTGLIHTIVLLDQRTSDQRRCRKRAPASHDELKTSGRPFRLLQYLATIGFLGPATCGRARHLKSPISCKARSECWREVEVKVSEVQKQQKSTEGIDNNGLATSLAYSQVSLHDSREC